MLETREATNAVILRVPASVNTNEDELTATVQGLLTEGKKDILLDLTDVSFADSCGLGILVNLFKLVKKANGSLAFYSAQPYIQKLVELTKLNRVLSIYEDEQAAIASLK